MIKIGFFGTPEISAFVLQELFDAGFNVRWAVTQPDRRSGRGLKLTQPPVKTKAEELGIEVFQSEKFDRGIFEEISKKPVDLSVVVAYGSYLPTYFIESFKTGPLNIHVSLLPKYRGAAPVARAIMNGDKETGVTIMKLSKEMDAGDIVVQKSIKIEDNDNVETLTWKLIKEGTKLLISNLTFYLDGKIKPLKQSDVKIEPSYANKIIAQEKRIDWGQSAKQIHDRVRALYPWPIAEAKINGVDVKLIKTSWSCHEVDGKPGEIVGVSRKENQIVVSTKDGVLLVEKVQPFGKREMTVSEFTNGYKIDKGMRFENV